MVDESCAVALANIGIRGPDVDAGKQCLIHSGVQRGEDGIDRVYAVCKHRAGLFESLEPIGRIEMLETFDGGILQVNVEPGTEKEESFWRRKTRSTVKRDGKCIC